MSMLHVSLEAEPSSVTDGILTPFVSPRAAKYRGRDQRAKTGPSHSHSNYASDPR